MLHAQHLGFLHPVTGLPMAFSAPLPEDMEAVRRALAAARRAPSRVLT
jgi:23S rRNA pseudouridine1911/1915/1917 synthase